MNRPLSLMPLALILIGLGLAMGRGGGGGSLAWSAASIVAEHVQAADRASQAKAVASLYAAAADRLADGSYNAMEAHQHVLDGVQQRHQPKSAGWAAAIKSIGLEVVRQAGEGASLADVRKAFLEVQSGLERVQ